MQRQRGKRPEGKQCLGSVNLPQDQYADDDEIKFDFDEQRPVGAVDRFNA